MLAAAPMGDFHGQRIFCDDFFNTPGWLEIFPAKLYDIFFLTLPGLNLISRYIKKIWKYNEH